MQSKYEHEAPRTSDTYAGADNLGTLKVQEGRGCDAVTAIANASEFIEHVINLRGAFASIVDTRIKFRLGKVEYDQFTLATQQAGAAGSSRRRARNASRGWARWRAG